MALFSRKKVDTLGVPAEVQNYYPTEKRGRTGVAWLLAFATLAVTILVVLGLFFGGRMAYRKLRPQDKPAPTNVATTDSSQTQNTSTPSGSTDTSNPPVANSAPDAPNAPTGPGNVNAPTQTGNTSNPAANTPQTSGPTANPASPTVASANLPKSGPGDMVAIFVLTTVTGAFAHGIVFRTRS